MSKVQPLSIELSGSCTIGKTGAMEFDVLAGYQKSKDGSYVYASLKVKKSTGLGLPDLLKLFAEGSEKETEIPEFLNHLPAIKELTMSYGSAATGSNDFALQFKTVINVNEKLLNATIQANYKKKTSGASAYTFSGILELGTHRFQLSFKKIEEDWYMYAGYLHRGSVFLQLRDIAGRFLDDVSGIPDVGFTLEKFKAFVMYRKQSDKGSTLLFGMGAGLSLNLEDLPLAGPVFAKTGGFAFQEVLAIYANGHFSKEELGNYPDMPEVTIAKGFNVPVQLLINGKQEYFSLNSELGKPLKLANDTKDPNKEVPVKSGEVSGLAGEISSKANWKKIEKQVGPLNIQRIGFLFNEGKVVLLLDASMQLAGMGMQLIGLGLGFKLAWKLPPDLPDFYIDGIGLSFVKDPIRISAMFLRATPQKDVESYSYYGAAQLSLSRFGISGIGAYSKLIEPQPDGAVSLFIYAMYNGAIGGPAFFFVTGVAAGFGYNRRVRVPAITEVSTFPLVAMTLNPDPKKTLNDILADLVSKQWIPASPGDYWMAIGLKFASFNLVESFVVIIAQFGTKLEFSVLGLSVLAWPSKANPIAYVELAIKISFGTANDAITAEAMLTPNSYLFNKNCRLTGGFAFYVWVKGEHEGDFVVTLGGYHPKFKKPAHYPEVDRLGLNWKLSKYLQIKGGMYFALTPSCIMAGGRLEVIFDLGFLKASIAAWIDMLIGWAPFQYAIEIGIIVRIVADINLGLFSIRFHLEMGAMLRIWGPPFAGEAYVDWSIFSFTIPFGDAAKKKNEKLDWDGFKDQFIPANTDQKIVPEIIIGQGIINEYKVKTSKGEEKYLLVNPHQLCVNVEAPLPVTRVTVPDETGRLKEMTDDAIMLVDGEAQHYSQRNQNLGIRPMQETNLLSDMSVEITMNGHSLSGDFTPDYAAYAAGVPESLWSHEQSTGNNNQPDEARVLKNAIKGVSINAKKAPVPVNAPMFDLDGKFQNVTETLRWEYIPARTGPDNTSFLDGVKGEILKTLGDQSLTAKRQTLIAKACTMQELNLEQYDEQVADWFDQMNALPVIVQLGGIPQYKSEIADSLV